MDAFKLKLARMAIGDALISDGGYAIDYVDPSGGTFHEPCYALRRGTDILYMTDNEYEEDRNGLVAFLAAHDFGDAPVGREWTLERSGSDANPMWDNPIGQLKVHNWKWMFAPSPYTRRCKTAEWVAKKYNHTPRIRDGAVTSVLVRFSVSGEPQDVPVYVIGRVYAVVEKLNKNSASPPVGFVQLTKISERSVAGACRNDLLTLGVTQFDQLRGAVSTYSPRRQYWAFTYRVVLTPNALVATPPAASLPRDAEPLQASFLQAVAV